MTGSSSGTPFGMRSSGTTFVRAIKNVLQPTHKFTKSFVDDMVVHTNDWDSHLVAVDRYLAAMKAGGFSLCLKKCEFGKPEVKLVGHIVGSGQRKPNPDKIVAVLNLKEPETKRQVRQIVYSHFFLISYLASPA